MARPRRPRPPDAAAVLASARDAILTETVDGIVTSCNPSAERLYGYAAEELVGRHISTLVPDDRRDELDEILSRASRGEPLDLVDTERVAKDGRRVLVSLAISPVLGEDGPVVAISTIARDITARVAAEEARHWTADSLRAVVEASPIAIEILDLDGRVQFWSPAAEAMLGWTAAEVMGAFPPTVPPDEEDAHRRFREQIETGTIVTGLASSRLRKDGTRLGVLAYGGPRRDASGRIVGVVEMLADVSQHRALEEQLLHAQKIEGIGRLAGGVAHDFNNVLTAVFGHAELLLVDAGEDEDVASHARSIRDAAQRGAGLTAQLLAFSRRQVLQPRLLDLGEEVRASRTLLEPLIGASIEFRINARDGAVHVRADPTQLQQVILNLAVNARDAMPDGGRLTLETDTVEFTEAYAADHFDLQPGTYAVLVVADTGIGMDRETRQNIFEPFFTTKPSGKGTGLGLATTYGIVRQSGGYIWLYSEPGLGTTFKIYFPLVTAEGQAVVPQARPELTAGSGTILLVEDESEVRDIERRLLERLGYRVLTAGDGLDALSTARAEGLERLDVLVTDVVMPRISGAELGKELRGERPDLPILFLSGYAEEMVGRGGAAAPGTAFLGKPFTPEALARKIRELLAGGATATANQRRASDAPGEADRGTG